MIVGLSTFDTVLDRIGRDRAEEPHQDARPWTGVRGFTAAFVGAGSPRRRPNPNRI